MYVWFLAILALNCFFVPPFLACCLYILFCQMFRVSSGLSNLISNLLVICIFWFVSSACLLFASSGLEARRPAAAIEATTRAMATVSFHNFDLRIFIISPVSCLSNVFPQFLACRGGLRRRSRPRREPWLGVFWGRWGWSARGQGVFEPELFTVAIITITITTIYYHYHYHYYY